MEKHQSDIGLSSPLPPPLAFHYCSGAVLDRFQHHRDPGTRDHQKGLFLVYVGADGCCSIVL